MDMKKKVMVVGELHQDLFYKTNLFTNLATDLANGLSGNNFPTQSPDELLTKILKLMDDSAKKVGGDTYIKRGGNGNNSANLLGKLNIPTQLMTTVGQGAEWMKDELQSLGINTETVFQVPYPTPISTIVEDPNITKIIVAPNLKEKMNFEEVKIGSEKFSEAKIVFFTPIALKYTKVLEMCHNLDLISIMTIETQKIQSYRDLDSTCTVASDIMFLNLNDGAQILNLSTTDSSTEGINTRLSQVDQVFRKYSRIRIYTLSKYGSWICLGENEPLNIPIIKVEVKNRTGAGDAFAAGFIAKLYELIESKSDFSSLDQSQLISLLKDCTSYARAAGALKVSTGESPNKEELDRFYLENPIM